MLTVVLTKTCSEPGCDKQHHAKGYCKTHYHNIVLTGYTGSDDTCSIEGCTDTVGKMGAHGLCCKHLTRLKRNGDPNIVKRLRRYHSFEQIKKDNPDTFLDFVIECRQHWARLCKKHYGDRCSLCNWNETTCDVDHVIDVAKGGTNTIRNGIVLCPNHHAIKHRSIKTPLATL